MHEFFCALLELLQREVLAGERAATGNACAPVWATLDPVTRNFSGTLLKRFTCRWGRGGGQGMAAAVHAWGPVATSAECSACFMCKMGLRAAAAASLCWP